MYVCFFWLDGARQLIASLWDDRAIVGGAKRLAHVWSVAAKPHEGYTLWLFNSLPWKIAHL